MSAYLKDLNDDGRERVVEMALQAFLHRLCLEQIDPLQRAERRLFSAITRFRRDLARVTAKGGREFMHTAQRELDTRHEEFRQGVAYLTDFAAHGGFRVIDHLGLLERTQTDMKKAFQGFAKDLQTKEGVWADSDVDICTKVANTTREAVLDLERLLPRLRLNDLYAAGEILKSDDAEIWFAGDHPDLVGEHPMALLLEKKVLLIKALPEEYLRFSQTKDQRVPTIRWDFSKTEEVIGTYAGITMKRKKAVRDLLPKERTSKLFDVIFSLFSKLANEAEVSRRQGHSILIYPSYDPTGLIRPGIPLEAMTVWGLCTHLEISYEAPSFVCFTVAAQPNRSFLTWLGVAPHNQGAFSAFHNPIS